MSHVLRVSTHIYGVCKEIDGKTFIFWVNLGNWFSNQSSAKSSPFLRVSTHIYGVSKEIDWKTFNLWVNLGMLPSNRLSRKYEPFSEGFNTHLWGFQEYRREKVYFLRIPRHVTSQIDCLWKMSPVLRVSTHIYGVSKKIDGKTFIFRVNLGIWPSNWSSWKNKPSSEGVNKHLWDFQGDRWETFILWVNLGVWPSNQLSWKNKPCSEAFNTHVWGFQGDRWENVHFLSKPRHVTPQINHLWKTSPVLRVSTHIYGVSKKKDGKRFIFRVNLGMWPSNQLSWKNEPCSEGLNTLYGISKEIDGKIYYLSKPRYMTLKSIILGKRDLFWGFQHTCIGFPRI